MKSRIASWLLRSLKAKVCTGAHHNLAVAAEAEFSAFYHAVRIHHGVAIAAAATEHWLQAFASASVAPENLEASFRKVTVAAASMLAAEITGKQQAPSHPFAYTPCHAASPSGCR